MQSDKKQFNDKPQTYSLRMEAATLSKQNAIDMITQYNFYDTDKNPQGKGLLHKYTFLDVNKNKIIIDDKTSLMWQRSGMTYLIKCGNAEKCINDFNNKYFAGYDNWRLPTLEEAMSLVECQKQDSGLYISNLFDKEQNWIWTSDLSDNGFDVWYVSFLSGKCGNSHLFNYGFDHVRAVRSL